MEKKNDTISYELLETMPDLQFNFKVSDSLWRAYNGSSQVIAMNYFCILHLLNATIIKRALLEGDNPSTYLELMKDVRKTCLELRRKFEESKKKAK